MGAHLTESQRGEIAHLADAAWRAWRRLDDHCRHDPGDEAPPQYVAAFEADGGRLCAEESEALEGLRAAVGEAIGEAPWVLLVPGWRAIAWSDRADGFAVVESERMLWFDRTDLAADGHLEAHHRAK